MEGSYNSRCPAVKRLLKEAQELHEATEEYYAHPVEDNLFEWHFTVRGPPDTEFDGGVYHGRIIMPADYPMKPPNIIFFTPNGRFEINKKICLSISGHHPETWQPSWSIRTALLAIIGFMPTPANGTIGSLDYTAEERAYLSRKSVDYNCPNCGRVGDLLKERTGANEELQKEAKEVSSLMTVTGKIEKGSSSKTIPSENTSTSEKSSLLTSLPTEAKQMAPQEDLSLGAASEGVVSSSNTLTSSSTTSPTHFHSSTEEVSPNQNIHSSTQSVGSINPSSPSSVNPPTSSYSLMANNILLSAAIVVLVALVLRRLFLLESESTDEMDEILV